MQQVITLSKENIQQVVDMSNDNTLVMVFWAEQSPESIELTNYFETLSNQQTGRFILAKVDCAVEQEIASYFRIQSVPTTLIMQKGQPVDGFVGQQSDAQIQQMLDKHAPALWELNLAKAKVLLSEGEAEQAAGLLKEALSDSNHPQVALALADAYLMQNEHSSAATLLEQIKLEDQDSYYKSLKTKLELALEAADTPEIRDLQQKYEQNPDDLSLLVSLAKALHQAGREEEALAPLYQVLTKDLSADNGAVKQAFMEMLTALGQGNSLASQYRRKLYSLLY